MVAGLLNRRLPGPGTAIVDSHVHYAGELFIGDTLTATVTAKAKHKQGHRIEFDCRCVNPAGEVIAAGSGKILDNGNTVPLAVKAGDKILFGKYSGTDIKIDGEEYLILREDEVLAIVG